MAYTSWTNKWLEVWNNTKYKIEVEWGYRQNPATNKTQYRATRLRVTSLTQYHSFVATNLVAGVAVHTSTRKTTSFGNQTVSKGGTTTFDCTDDSREFEHNKDGAVPEKSVYLHFYCTVGFDDYGEPNVGWTTVELKNHIPTIDRYVPVTTATVDTVFTDSVALKVTSDCKTQYARYSLDNEANWVYVTPPTELGESGGGTGVLTIASLEPNTSYSMSWQVRRDYNELWSNTVTVEFTTLSDQTTFYIKDGTWKLARVWMKNGNWKKVLRKFKMEEERWI